MVTAWKAYGNEKAIMVFVVEEGESNKFDQLHLQYAVESKGVTVRLLLLLLLYLYLYIYIYMYIYRYIVDHSTNFVNKYLLKTKMKKEE